MSQNCDHFTERTRIDITIMREKNIIALRFNLLSNCSSDHDEKECHDEVSGIMLVSFTLGYQIVSLLSPPHCYSSSKAAWGKQFSGKNVGRISCVALTHLCFIPCSPHRQSLQLHETFGLMASLFRPIWLVPFFKVRVDVGIQVLLPVVKRE